MLLVEQMERRVLADRQALLARGVTENLPSPAAEQAAFDSWLVAAPAAQVVLTQADMEKLDELRALGVR